jgi:hypothetical protein
MACPQDLETSQAVKAWLRCSTKKKSIKILVEFSHFFQPHPHRLKGPLKNPVGRAKCPSG